MNTAGNVFAGRLEPVPYEKSPFTAGRLPELPEKADPKDLGAGSG